MRKRDRRIDAYIEKSAEFARPILVRIRDVVHVACPGMEETLKWNLPTFTYRGILCGMAAYKRHCVLGFWKGSQILDPKGIRADEAMGQSGRLIAVSDLPPRKMLIAYIKKAMALNEQGVKVPAAPRPKEKPVVVPAVLKSALAMNSKARATIRALSPSHRREYVEWITEAKGADTRQRRLATTLQWLAEGKSRNWKYER